MPDIPKLLTARDLQKILKCSLPLVYKMAERSQIPCVRWDAPGDGTRKKTVIRFKFDDVQKFIEGAYNA